MPERLALRMLGRIPSGRLHVEPASLGIGIVHLGIGAFHRAHQAAIVDETIAATGDPRWGICGVTMRSEQVVQQLRPQDGLYSLLERGPGAAPLRVIGSVREVLSARGDAELVIDRLADPAVSLVTLTVTEKGYRRDLRTGALDLHDEAVLADLAAAAAHDTTASHNPAAPGPRSTVGLLVAGLSRRRAHDAGPLTVVCCDNLPENGRVLARLVSDFVDAAGDPVLRDWIAGNVAFPSTMVDRITPATTADDLAAVAGELGLDDLGAVVAEPFRQWIVEDDFAGARPAWEHAGVTMVDDVRPWESAKLRLLNATHSLLAYTGLALGLGTIAEAVAQPSLRALATRLQLGEVAPTLDAPDGLDVADYSRTLLERFANPALRHTTRQVASDGTQKLGPRLAETIARNLAEAVLPRAAAAAVAGWMLHVVRASATELDEPVAERLKSLVAGTAGTLAIVSALLPETGIPLPADAERAFLDLVASAYDALSSGDPAAIDQYLT